MWIGTHWGVFGPGDSLNFLCYWEEITEGTNKIRELGMDLALNEEQQLIVDMVRRFVHEEILPLEATLDPDADELPREDYERLVAMVQEMGFYGLDTPPEYGGPDIDLVTRCLIAIECAQHRAGLYAPCYYAFGGARQAQLFEGPQKRRKRNTSTPHATR